MTLVEALKSLLKEVPDKEFGICCNLEDKLKVQRPLGWSEAIKSWDGFITGGSVVCPVENDVMVHLDDQRKWDKRTKFGKRRYSLLNHLIKYYEELENESSETIS